MVRGQLQRAEAEELEDLITELLHSSGHVCAASLTAVFQLSGVMSHVLTYLYGIVTAISFGSTVLAFRS
jgi:hypothetical protein